MGKTEPQNSNLKSAPRQQINNFNPYNRLNLNKFHQIDGQPRHAKEGRSIRKKKRDLERLLKHKQLQEVDV